MSNTHTLEAAAGARASRSLSLSHILQLTAAFALGVAFLALTGFAQSDILHNAAHDTRHALAFPCH